MSTSGRAKCIDCGLEISRDIKAIEKHQEEVGCGQIYSRHILLLLLLLLHHIFIYNSNLSLLLNIYVSLCSYLCIYALLVCIQCPVTLLGISSNVTPSSPGRRSSSLSYGATLSPSRNSGRGMLSYKQCIYITYDRNLTL